MNHEYNKLQIWVDARKLNELIYHISNQFPKEEKYGLSRQIRRASVSIASNISEGSSYRSDKMFLKYLDHSLGSLCEVETQMYLAFDIAYIDERELNNMLEKTIVLKRKMLAFIKRLQRT